jgi:hypothetical protein
MLPLDTFRNLPGADKWVIANHMNMFAYFRVNYDKQNWLTLTEQLLLNHKVICESKSNLIKNK